MSTGAGYIVQGPKRVAAVLLAVMKLVSTASQTTGDRTTDWLRRHLKSDRESIPSAIDANMFLAANSTRLDGTIYFWTCISYSISK
jgi:hypothetical protein